MVDHAQFSDDISGLWGPGDEGVLDPAPVRRVPSSAASEPDPDGRAGDMAQEVRRLQEMVTAVSAALRCELEVELRRQQSVGAQAIETGLAAIEAGLREQLTALEHRVDELEDATREVDARVTAEAAAGRHEAARLAGAIEAHEAEPVGKHRAWKVRHELQADVDRRLDGMTEREATLQAQLDAVAQRLDALTDRTVAPS